MPKVLLLVFLPIAIIVAAAVAIFLFFPQLWLSIFIGYKYPQSKYPIVYVKPVDRQLSVSNSPSLSHFSMFRVNFAAPWKEKSKKIGETGGSVEFEEGINMGFISNQNLPPIQGLLKQPEKEKVKQVFGEENLKSSYRFQKIIYETVPSELNFRTSQSEATAKSILIILKSGSLAIESKSIYLFNNGKVKGFQLGEPGKDDRVILDVYDSEEHFYTFVLSGSIAQPDLDHVLSSISFGESKQVEVQSAQPALVDPNVDPTANSAFSILLKRYIQASSSATPR